MTRSSERPVAARWQMLRQTGRKALIPYIPAGFPSLEESGDMLRRAERVGADFIEVGVPFSDPLADGPIIQRAVQHALEGGTTLTKVLDLISTTDLHVPIVLFTYLNPILAYGVTALLRDAKQAGVAAVLVTDLPVGADPAIEREIETSELDRIRLVAPTTQGTRLTQTLDGARGFLYLISRLGVTGVHHQLSDSIAHGIELIRTESTLPVAVGFGVSTPEHARRAAALADGVVVGSVIVDALAREGAASAEALLGAMRTALDHEQVTTPT